MAPDILTCYLIKGNQITSLYNSLNSLISFNHALITDTFSYVRGGFDLK
jgi:hypothetical protein